MQGYVGSTVIHRNASLFSDTNLFTYYILHISHILYLSTKFYLTTIPHCFMLLVPHFRLHLLLSLIVDDIFIANTLLFNEYPHCCILFRSRTNSRGKIWVKVVNKSNDPRIKRTQNKVYHLCYSYVVEIYDRSISDFIFSHFTRIQTFEDEAANDSTKAHHKLVYPDIKIKFGCSNHSFKFVPR